MVEGQKTHYAMCILNPDGGSGVSGFTKFVQVEGEPIQINGEMNGLTPGKHGFHVHQFGNLIEGCKTAGPHWNPEGVTHGGPGKATRHHGDLGNIEAGEDGKGVYSATDDRLMLYGPLSIIGRSMVCHAGIDDLGEGGNDESLKTGNAGGRVACGVIGTSGPF